MSTTPDPTDTPAGADPNPAPPAVETDDRFPSGPWTGFFLQPGSKERHGMDLRLTFRQATITGEGHDRVGAFLIRGRYQVDDGRCWWTKRYIGRHDISYTGYNEGRGIWGNWEFDARTAPGWRGGFTIWPEGMADPTLNRRSESADLPADDGPPTVVLEEVEAEELVTVGGGS